MLPIPPVPARLLEEPGLTLPSPEFEAWARAAFIDVETSPLHNPEHAYLGLASLGFLLTSADNTSRQGVRTLGTCQMGEPTGAKWPAAQRRQQIEDWFGRVPTFLVTLDAVFVSVASAVQTCALVEHELYHATVETDRWVSPRRERGTDRPVFGLRAHDVEEFVGVARRYGAWSDGLRGMKDALAAEPTHTMERLDGVCGCGARIG